MKWSIYIIQSGNHKKAPIKIGMTSNMSKRMESLQTGNPYRLNIICKIDGFDKLEAYNLERYLQKSLDDYRIHGEWFRHGKYSFKKLIDAYIEKRK